MKRKWLKITVYSFWMLVLPVTLRGQADSLLQSNYLTRTMMYGVGYANIYDTYLSPQEYRGPELRISREIMRMSRCLKNVSIQNYLQANFSYTHNRADNNNTLAGLVSWNYGMHYNFRLNENIKFLAGGLSDFNGGFVYNLRNSNNPASAKAYINLAVSGMIIWDFRLKGQPFSLRYQANAPVLGVMFSPNYGQSYYEIFTLGNYSGVFNLTSFDKQPSIRQFLSLDIPLNHSRLRFSYIYDIQQSKVNSIKTHTYSHAFMVGIVKEFYRIRRKQK